MALKKVMVVGIVFYLQTPAGTTGVVEGWSRLGWDFDGVQAASQKSAALKKSPADFCEIKEDLPTVCHGQGGRETTFVDQFSSFKLL